MDAATQRELEQFLQLEQQKQKFQASVHQFTDRCWEKCIGMRVVVIADPNLNASKYAAV